MIREANRSDCINLAALSLKVWLRTYCVDGIRAENSYFALSTFTEDSFLGKLSDPDRRILVFVEGVYLRGYILVNLKSHHRNAEKGFEIEKLYVQEAFRNKGIGQKLLEEIKERYGGDFWLYTWVRNKSIQFYKIFGFEDVGQYDLQFGNDTVENRVLVYHDKKKFKPYSPARFTINKVEL